MIQFMSSIVSITNEVCPVRDFLKKFTVANRHKVCSYVICLLGHLDSAKYMEFVNFVIDRQCCR